VAIDDNELIELHSDGRSLREIASLLGTSKDSIRRRLDEILKTGDS
jgi:DNA-binding Lrp family transcriptional regulator